jgi:hypothetical protein
MLVLRSSAGPEDQATSSHAGVNATFVGDNNVVDLVRQCWAFLWTETA